ATFCPAQKPPRSLKYPHPIVCWATRRRRSDGLQRCPTPCGFGSRVSSEELSYQRPARKGVPTMRWLSATGFKTISEPGEVRRIGSLPASIFCWRHRKRGKTIKLLWRRHLIVRGCYSTEHSMRPHRREKVNRPRAGAYSSWPSSWRTFRHFRLAYLSILAALIRPLTRTRRASFTWRPAEV